MARRYKEYHEYKESGVDWLGKVPNHWGLVPLRNVLEFRNEKNSPEKTSNILSLSIAKGVTEYSESEGKSGNKRKDDLTAYKLAYPNDIVMNSMNIIVGAVGISKYFGAISPVYYALYAKDKTALIAYYGSIFHNAGFQRGLLKFGKGILIKQSDSGKLNTIRMKVSQDDLKTMYFPKPPIEEQQKIANFLDHETAKIDTLIAKQEKLIELLKEKRQAVISHAVTKGLSPHAPMKDSGVEWLGEVPEHWSLTPLKYLCSFSGGGTPTKDNLSYWTDGTVPWVSPKDMKSLRITQTTDYITEPAVHESSTNFVDTGALLMVVRSGILQRTIPVAINDVTVTLNQDMKALTFNSKMNADFALNFIVGYQKALLLEWSKEGATVESIEHEYLVSGLLPVPPIDEQSFIVGHLSKEMEKFDKLESQATVGIELLKERKTALISAAVTGKIDVRGWESK